MKKTRFFGLLIVIGLISVAGVSAQASGTHHVFVNIPAIALLAVDGPAVTLSVTPPTQTGEVATGDTNSATHLFYTSLRPSSGDHKITVGALATPTVPTGLTVEVEATNISATGDGGTLGAVVDFDDIASPALAKTLISSIGSCYTGRTSGSSGAELTYTLSFLDMTVLQGLTGALDFTLTYTIVAE
jgi:hypothetical protein